MLSEMRRLLDRVAARVGWKWGEIRHRIFRHTYCAAGSAAPGSHSLRASLASASRASMTYGCSSGSGRRDASVTKR
jgi:hypothetical protein